MADARDSAREGGRDAHLFGAGPKRILALDGGGTLGIVELAFLARLEALLRAHYGNDPAFRLGDWFDLIGGTSTGAIIAAGLATGMSVADLTRMYLELGPIAFRRWRWRPVGLVPRYDSAPLYQLLLRQLGERTLDDPGIRTGLAIIARRFDTGSPWLISNNPRAPYWNDPEDGAVIGNRHYQLAQVVRASTAAPGFFRPEWLQVVPGAKPALFVDGGLSPYNNPSLQLLMLTQARAFGLRWPLGPERLLLVSVGTGQYRRGLHGAPQPTTAAGLALHSLMDAVADSQVLTLTLLQWFGQPALRWTINSEIGDLAGEVLGGHPLLAFARYNMPLESEWLERELGVRLGEPEMARLRRFNDPGNMNELHAMATRVAERQVQPEHIPTSFLEQPVG